MRLVDVRVMPVTCQKCSRDCDETGELCPGGCGQIIKDTIECPSAAPDTRKTDLTDVGARNECVLPRPRRT